MSWNSNSWLLYDILGILMPILDLFSKVEETSPDLVSPTLPFDKLPFVSIAFS